MDKESGVKERKESTNKTNMASLRVIFVTDSLVLGTGFFFDYFAFPLSVSFHQLSVLMFVYMSLLPEGKVKEVCKTSKKQYSI